MTSAVTISIDRTSLSLSPLVLTGSHDGSAMRIFGYAPPAEQSRVTYAPDSADINGSVAVAASLQQAILGFSVKMTVTSETDLRTAYKALAAAIRQFAFTVTTTVSGAPAEVWSADSGAIQLADPTGRTPWDIRNLNPVYSVTIPVYPVPA